MTDNFTWVHSIGTGRRPARAWWVRRVRIGGVCIFALSSHSVIIVIRVLTVWIVVPD